MLLAMTKKGATTHINEYKGGLKRKGDFFVHPIIRVDGDKATGKWLIYLMYCYPRTGQSLFWVQLFYNNEYVREKGEWKISLMTAWERMGLPGTGPPTGLL